MTGQTFGNYVYTLFHPINKIYNSGGFNRNPFLKFSSQTKPEAKSSMGISPYFIGQANIMLWIFFIIDRTCVILIIASHPASDCPTRS